MAVAVKEKQVKLITEPGFRDPSTMTPKELNDPDYRLKQVMEQFGNGKKDKPAVCSKCHHCR